MFQRIKAPSNAVNASKFEMGENERPVMAEELVYLIVSQRQCWRNIKMSA